MGKIKGKILIIDDNEGIRKSLSFILRQEFEEVETVGIPSRFASLVQSGIYDVILLDMNFSAGVNNGNEGIFWLREILKTDPAAVVILITAYGDVELAVKAMKEGAIDFVQKPFDAVKLVLLVKTAFQLRQSKMQLAKLKDTQKHLSDELNRKYTTLIGKSAALNQVLEIVKKVAPTDANLLILGENGTGKELIAREIHRQSKRFAEVFIPVDLGAIPETLFESELFGHVRGAFTDAKEDRKGRFEIASGGTLFLDEIGNLPLSLQSKLLTVLQNRFLYPVGSTKPVPFDVRLITATNKPLPALIKQGMFREDLLYRINTVQLEIPPLRKRGEDILLLAAYFLSVYTKKYGKPNLKLGVSANAKLMEYAWPGNVRELEHLIENAVIMTDYDIIGSENLRFTHLVNDEREQFASLNLECIEKQVVKEALFKHRGNINQAAMELGITRKTLYAKIQKYEL